jgi:hypothetical protein
MNKRDLSILLFPLLIAAPGCLDAGDDADLGADEDVAAETSAVVGGSFEPDERFPWEVSLNGCHGTLIEPSWVLTAAHCVPRNGWSYRVSYSRVDSVTGQEHTGLRNVSVVNGVYVHPDYQMPGGFSSGRADIALVHLDTPFVIDQYISTAAIPTAPRIVGHVGTIAGGSHSNANLPTNLAAVFRTPISATNPFGCGADGQFCVTSPSASLCHGDSGSGFVTIENSRATVTGIASYSNATDCATPQPSAYAGLTDVYSYRDWVLSTMHTNDAALGGNTRVHTSGRAADGVIGIGCTNPYGTMWGTMRAAGVGLGANCAAGETQSVVCWLGNHQTDANVAIRGFSMKTTYANGVSTVTSLPYSATSATYYGVMPTGVTREFTCTVTAPRIIVVPPRDLPRLEAANL